MSSSTITVKFLGDAKSLDAASKRASKSLGAVDSTGKKAATGLSSSFAKIALGGVAIALVGKAFKTAFSEAEEAQKVGRATAAVLESTGGAANVTAKKIEALAGSLSKKAAVDDELIQSGANVLLTFTNIKNEVGAGNDIFNQATAAAVDLSAALGQDLQSSVVQIGKALNDPIKGITALSRVGVSFTAQQKQQVKALVDSGRAMDAQKLILAELKTEFGGAAEANATSSAKVSVAFGNLAESVGTLLLPVIETAADALAGFAGFLTENHAAAIALGVAIAGLAAAVGLVKLAKFVGELRETASAMKKSAASMSQTKWAAAGAVGAVVALALAARQLNKNANYLTVSVEKLSQATDRDLVAGWTKLQPLLKGTGREMEAFRQVAEGNIGTAKRLVALLDKQGVDTAAYGEIIKDVARGQKQANQDTDAGAKSLDKYGKAAVSASREVEDYARQLSNARLEVERLSDKQAQSGDDRRALNSLVRQQTSDTLDLADAAKELADARAKGDPTEITRAELAFADAQDRVAQTFSDGFQKAKDYAVGLTGAKDETAALTDKTSAYLTNLNNFANTLDSGSPLRKQIKGYITDLGGIPTDKNTKITIDSGEALHRLAELKAAVAAINPNIDFKAVLRAEGGRASGGPVKAGHVYMVGEQGPEPFIPATNGTILPNSSLSTPGPMSAAGSPSIVVNVDARGSVGLDPRAIQDLVIAVFAKHVRAGGTLKIAG